MRPQCVLSAHEEQKKVGFEPQLLKELAAHVVLLNEVRALVQVTGVLLSTLFLKVFVEALQRGGRIST